MRPLISPQVAESKSGTRRLDTCRYHKLSYHGPRDWQLCKVTLFASLFHPSFSPEHDSTAHSDRTPRHSTQLAH